MKNKKIFWVLCAVVMAAVFFVYPKNNPAKTIADSVYVKDGNVYFEIPQDVKAEDINILISGRQQFSDGFSQSVHYLEGEKWEKGSSYTFPCDDSCTDLNMDIYCKDSSGKSYEKTVDILKLR